MELVIGLVIIVGIAYWLYTQNTKEAATAEAPYKVETPAVVQEVKEVIPEAVVVAPAEVVAEVVAVAPAEPVKKTRKPRVVKTVEVAAKVTKVAAKAPRVAAKVTKVAAKATTKPAAIKAKSKKV